MSLFGSKGGSSSQSTAQKTENQYGSHTPDLSDSWKLAYNNVVNSLGQNGANQGQMQGMNYIAGQMANNPVNAATTSTNANLGQYGHGFSGLNDQLNSIANNPNYANSFQSTAYGAAPVSAGASGASGNYNGADFAGQYRDLFGSQVTDPALRAYDYGTARSLAELDSRTAAAGGFANSRSSEIPYSDLFTQSALGRGQLSAQLNNQGLTNALGFAQSDASRASQNNQFNVGQANAQNQFNANLAQQGNIFNAGQNTQNSQFNAGQQQNNSQFNANSANQNAQTRLSALSQMAGNLQSQAGLTSQQLQNVVTANGIYVDAAKTLFDQGSITNAQLMAIVQAATAANGYSYNQTTNSNSSQQGSGRNWSVGGGYTFPA